MKDWTPVISVILSGIIAFSTSYYVNIVGEDAQRRQFLIERSQSFSEFLALNYLPRAGSVPTECQVRLEECRRLRQVAIQTYLFLPTNIQSKLIQSYGPKAVEATEKQPSDLPPSLSRFTTLSRRPGIG